MIRRVVLRRFKRFEEVTFDLPGHVVFAGLNNSGKTTLLQAIAAWSFALQRWKLLNNFQRRGGAYPLAPISRPAFTPVPLRSFDLLWRDRDYQGSIVVTVESSDGWSLAMEFRADSSEQVHVRPLAAAEPELVRSVDLNCVFVPPMTGLSIEEPVYQRPKIDQLLATAKPGDVLRNLLVEASESSDAWSALTSSIQRLFDCELLPPDASGANIVAEYRSGGTSPLDIASAGSGLQQVLMLLTFLHARPGSVLLLDEPDAHLHVFLQDAIFGELRAVAAQRRSQLIVATHSEVIINSVDPSELCALLSTPRPLASLADRERLTRSLRVLTNAEVLQAVGAPGILYVEGPTDLAILRAWARVLSHPARELLEPQLLWREKISQNREGGTGIQSREHYDALRLVRDELPGLEIIDGDAHSDIRDTPITGVGLQRLRWQRYEIESYLIHPASLDRFVSQQLGGDDASREAREILRRELVRLFREEFVADPFANNPLVEAYFKTTKARTAILPPLLAAASLPAFPYTRFHEIAAVMLPEEIHPEVREKLDLLCRAFRR